MKTVLLLSFALSAWAQDVDVAAAKKAEQRECTQCHSLRLIHSQRLSKAAWGKELDKMAGWGAPIKDRELLLNYLSAEYSDAKPVPNDPLSSDGSSKSR
jgi:mono/diheme cytochrome c family protein